MKKRLLALFLSMTLLVSVVTMPSRANNQIQVEKVNISEVSYVEGLDVVTGKPLIKPTMTVKWTNPTKWADSTDSLPIHTPDYYEVVVNNLTRGTSNTVKINNGSDEFKASSVDLQEKLNLDTGSLYNIEVKPYHYHPLEEGTGFELAPVSGLPENAYAITDLNVDFETTETTIQVIWDDLGVANFQYRIAYAIGDYTNKPKEELLNNKEGEIKELTSDSTNVTKYYDQVTKRNKLVYTIKENVYPGQVYSVLVEPTVEYYNTKAIMQNVNYPVIRSCSTNVNLQAFEEGDYVRLEWDIPSTFKVGQDKDEYELVEATLVSYRDGQSSNVVIFDGNAAIIGYYKVTKPTKETDYQIEFVYRAVADQTKPPIEPISNMASFVPSELRLKPTRPVVPHLITKEILKEIMESPDPRAEKDKLLEERYYVPGYTYEGSLDKLLIQNTTYQLLDNNQGINFIWSAFERIDVDKNSPTYKDPIYDANVYYDIWVTESMEGWTDAKKAITDQRYGTNTQSHNITKGTKIYGYREVLADYYNEDSGEMEPIIPGKLYYITVVAKKKTGMGELVSEPTTVSLYYGYKGDAYEPPTITKPPLEVKESVTTDTSVTIRWRESWTEIISPNALATDALSAWRHEVWVSPTGVITASKPANSTDPTAIDPTATPPYFPIYKGQDEVDKFQTYLNKVAPGNTVIVDWREVDLGQDASSNSDIKYKFLKIPYANVLAAIAAKQKVDSTYNFNKYYEDMIKADKEGKVPLSWVNIASSVDTEDATKLLYKESGLLPNTTYLFMLYPYRELYNGQVLYAHYPTPIVVSTKPTEIVVNPDPTVPNLYAVDPTDTSITLAWKYNLDFNYELVYSIFEDITKAKPVEWKLPTNKLDPKYPTNGKFEVPVNDLFPNTEYYFWIRAKQPANNTTSHWSNAVLGRTRDVSSPYPPNGFGIASQESMKKYGFDASVTDDYIAIEWILDPLDVPQVTSKKVKKTYTYVIEVSDNPKFIDPIYIESSGGNEDVAPDNVEFIQKNLIIINNLVPNRAYYIRVKTRLIVKGAEEDQLIEKDSLGYTPTIKIITVSIGDEYDGIIDPDLEVLPSEDYELIYNKYNEILEFRFRDHGVGDNNVDQRLITSLITQNIYVYNIDVSGYENKPIAKRIITIPYAIIEAFNTHEVTIRINTGDLVLELPAQSIVGSINEQVKQFGVAPDVKIQIDTLAKTYLAQQMAGQPIRPVATALDVGISIKSEKLYHSLRYTDKPLDVKLLVNNKFEQFRVNRLGAVKDNDSKWTAVPATFDGNTGYMSFQTAKVGVYGGYVLDNAMITADKGHWSEGFRKDVMQAYTLQGLGTYNPNHKVSEAKMINVIYPLVQGEKVIDLSAQVTTDILSDLKYANIKNNSSSTKGQITREEAISMMVRSYEIMQDKVITPNATSTKAVNNNPSISSSYKTAMAKAATIGLVSQLSTSRPKDALTYGELFALWSKLIK